MVGVYPKIKMQQERQQSSRSVYLHAKTNYFCVKFRSAASVTTCELGRFSFSFSLVLKLKNFVFKLQSQPITSHACPCHPRRRFSFRSKLLRVIQRFRTLTIMHPPLSVKNMPNGQFQHSRAIRLLNWFQRLAIKEQRFIFCGLSAVIAYLSQFVIRGNTKAVLFTTHSCLGLLFLWVLLRKCTKVKISIVLFILAFAYACGFSNQVDGVEKYQQWAWRAWKYVIFNNYF